MEAESSQEKEGVSSQEREVESSVVKDDGNSHGSELLNEQASQNEQVGENELLSYAAHFDQAPAENGQKTEIAEQGNNENSSENIEDIPLNRQPVVLPGGIVMPPPRVETINTSWKTQHLSHEMLNEYCRKLFKFKTVNIMHFK